MSVPAATGDEGRKTLQEELDEVRSDIIRLAALTTEAIAAGTQAFLDGDLNEAEPLFYLGRLAMFGLIIVAIIQKNRPNKHSP